MENVHVKLNSFGMRMRQEREAKGITISEFARKANMHKQTVYKYERDITKNVPYDVVKRVADMLDVNPCYLVGWTEDKEYPSYLRKEDYSNIQI